MARKKTGDKQADKHASENPKEVEHTSNVHADNNSIAVGSIQIGGDITGDIHIGQSYTAAQASHLLKQNTSTDQPKPFDGRCPYKGLAVFEEEDAEFFFGREKLVEELVSRVKESGVVFITGPSGSGKSSLVRAGLIPALKRGEMQGSDRWLYKTMKPGREPIKELGLAFSGLKGPELAEYFQAHVREPDILHRCAESVLSGRKDQRLVLFVDQFEEVFTQINAEEERLAFINMLTNAAMVKNGRAILLFAMRSEFLTNCALYPTLNELLNQEFRQIGAMQPEELIASVALPARQVGLPIEDQLIARIINDMKGNPGALPLMQFTLKDLFDAQQAKGGVIALTLADYVQRGGLDVSVQRYGDEAFAKLNAREQILARSIFSALVETGLGRPTTRRTALFEELIPVNATPDEVAALVQKLADARLVITDEISGKDIVTLAHEKLIDDWQLLKKLVDENRDAIALQNQITLDAKEWDEYQRDPSYLYSGARLANARRQLEEKNLVLSGLAREFITEAETSQQKFSLRNVLQSLIVPRQSSQKTDTDYARRVAALEAKLAELEAQKQLRPLRTVQPNREAAYKKYALVIGNTLYEDSHFAQLKTPEQDVTALAEILQHPQIGGFEDVQTLVNQSSSEIEAAIGDFCVDRGPDELMLLYFSGHGILDAQGRLYLAARNTRYDRPSGRAILSQFITDNMDASRCKRQVLILDCCHSGAFHRGAKGAIGKKAITEATFEGKGYGRVVLTATDATQYAWENDQVIGESVNSVFTHFIIDGLKSGAADMDGDGWITVDELYDYVYQRIVSSMPKQTPGRWIYRQQGKFFLANNPNLESQ